MKSIRDAVENATISSYCYIILTPELNTTRILMNGMLKRNSRNVKKDVISILTQWGISQLIEETDDGLKVEDKIHTNTTKATKHIRKLLNQQREKHYIKEWRKLQFSSTVLNADINLDLSSRWMGMKGMLGSAKNFQYIIIAQERCAYTNARSGHNDGKCRTGCGATETTKHIISICPHFRPTSLT